MTDTNTDELLKRLQALEAENERLKQEKTDLPAQLVVVETEYKGHPMLEFRRANAKPFSMGLKKLETIKEGWEHVEKFLKKHGNTENTEQI